MKLFDEKRVVLGKHAYGPFQNTSGGGGRNRVMQTETWQKVESLVKTDGTVARDLFLAYLPGMCRGMGISPTAPNAEAAALA
jgi:hypothetical protein